jgi:nucleotide-binding universal stress UspA family protein
MDLPLSTSKTLNMPSIVVGVDFSKTSIHAIDYAVPIANKMKADLVLVWVEKTGNSESFYPDISDEQMIEAKKRFRELQELYGTKMNKGVGLEFKLRRGKIYHEIENLARTIKASLIITGAHGISGFEEYWIGSNAFKIMTYSTCPVITVRQDFPVKKSINKILVPVDSSGETLQKIPFISTLAELFKSEVHVFTTHSSHLRSIQRITEKYTDLVLAYFAKRKVKTVSEAVVVSDITRSILSYASTIGADLIGIMTEQETPVNILMGPHAQQLVNQSPVPVLSIHPRENFCL